MADLCLRSKLFCFTPVLGKLIVCSCRCDWSGPEQGLLADSD